MQRDEAFLSAARSKRAIVIRSWRAPLRRPRARNNSASTFPAPAATERRPPGWSRLRLGALLLGLTLSGCVTVDYIGKTFPPTADVALFMSPIDVKQPYEVIGEARAQVGALPFSNSGKELQDKLLEEARARGADAIILGSLDTRQVGQVSQTTGQATTKYKGNKKATQYTDTTTTSTDEVTELRGTLIRYTR